MDANEFAYLKGQIASGNVILFTGAGFSLRALAEDGKPIPTATQIREDLWQLVYGNVEWDGSTLADVFGAAQQQKATATKELLSKRLKVSRKDLPDEYRLWFSFPWRRVYTLNVDNLPEVVQVEHQLPRRIRSVSALTDAPPPPTSDLVVVHLNGTVSDLPNVTFSARNYAERQAFADLWYPTLVRELSSHPVLYVGSTLDEPPLWQYVEARPLRARGARELRPKSFLITKSLPLGRQSMLGEFNIRYEETIQEEFCATTLSQLTDAATEGIDHLRRAELASSAQPALQNVSDLASASLQDAAELLAGREPRWPDVTEGFAVEREFDRTTLAAIKEEGLRLVVITGTAGAGKTMSAMRIALALSADGTPGYVYNSDFAGGIRPIRDAAKAVKAGVVLIDASDRFGGAMADLLIALSEDDPDRVVIATIRTTRRDQDAIDRIESAGGVEFSVPSLDDSDIAALLDALTEARRLGKLREMNRGAQETVFRTKSGRQLLVAMIEATSGLRFGEKISSECHQLGAQGALVYAVLTLATAFETTLTRPEVLTACGGDPVAVNAAFQELLDQHLVVSDPKGRFGIRHRVIAERAIDYFQNERSLAEPLRGLVFALASSVQPSDRYSRIRRLLNRLMNHATLIRLLFPKTPDQIDLDAVRSVYDTVEPLLGDDFHYWLQRGSFEVEEGDLGHANQCLEQARAIAPEDQLVLTEWGYLLLKRASKHASDPSSVDEAEEGFRLLEEQIEIRGDRDAYPYHVFGSQGLAYIKRSPMGDAARVDAYDRLRDVVRKGLERHSGRQDLKQLNSDLDHEYMMLAVPHETVAAATGSNTGDEPSEPTS